MRNLTNSPRFAALALAACFAIAACTEGNPQSTIPLPILQQDGFYDADGAPKGALLIESGQFAYIGQEVVITGKSDRDAYATVMIQNPDRSVATLVTNTRLSANEWTQLAPSDGKRLIASAPAGRTVVFLILSEQPLYLGQAAWPTSTAMARNLVQYDASSNFYTVSEAVVDVVNRPS